MRCILFCILFCITFASCGRNESGKPLPTHDYLQEVQAQRIEKVHSAREMAKILWRATQNGRLWDFHQTDWFTHRGEYLGRTTVINDREYTMETAP